MATLTSMNNFLHKAKRSHKYSNFTLFSRRETEYSSRVKHKNSSNISSTIQRPYSTSNKKITFRNFKKPLNNKLIKPNIPSIFSENQSLLLTKTTSEKSSNKKKRIHVEDYFHRKNKSKTNQDNIAESILNLEKYYTPNTSFNIKKKKVNSNLNINSNAYFNDLKYINQIYLTEANIRKPLFAKNNLTLNNYNYDDYNEFINKDFSKNQDADILWKFMSDKSNYNIDENLKTEYNKRVINAKRKRINLGRAKKEEFMEKIRKQKYDKLTLNAKKELSLRIEEIYQNKLEYLDDRIEAFESWKSLNRNFLDNKIGDYLKFLMHKKAYEKNKVEDLLEKIILLKKDLNRLSSKMAKIEIEKNKILGWVYFQIKLKEKKTELPNYYKLILEKINLIDNFYETKMKSDKNSDFIHNSLISNSNTSSPSKKNFGKKALKRSAISANIDKGKEKPIIKLDNELISFLNKKEGKNEYLRIKEYKNSLIYRNYEEFNDRLLSIEREDLRLIEYNDFIKEKIFWLKKELDKATKEKKALLNIYNYNLQINLNELNRLKQRYSTMKEIIQNLEKNKNSNKSNNKINNKNNYKEKSKKRNKSAFIVSKKNKVKVFGKKELYIKINKLFNLCKLVNVKNQKDYEMLDEKRKDLKNNEIVYNFFYIEYCYNYLINEIKDFKINNKDGEKIIKTIMLEIERGHRIEKAEQMRKELRDKFIKLEYEVNKRNNKIYFLPYRKVREEMNIKKETIVLKNKDYQQPNFEDFIYEDNDDINSLNSFTYQDQSIQ